MERFKKIVSVFFFTLVFLLALIVGTLRLEVLNSRFVFGSFERNGVYEKLPGQFSESLLNDPNLEEEEKMGYSEIASSISPQTAKRIIEANLGNVIDFLNGKSKDINIFISAKDISILQTDVRWSPKDAPGSNSLVIFSGLGNKLLIAFVILLAILAFLYKLAGRTGFLSAGILAVGLGAIGRLYLFVISANTPAGEPSQVLLLLLSSSVLADITLSWIVVGIIMVTIWLIFKTKPFHKVGF